jgi:hypothetical protein
MVVTLLLREVGAGVLEGLTRDEAEAKFPKELQTWLARGDLDAIPGAETGEALQARCVGFAALSAGRTTASAAPRDVDHRGGGTHYVVTHAALLRCLVNTLQGRPRTTPVAVSHDDSHLVDDPWESLAPVRLGDPWRRPSFRVSTADGEYFIKWEHDDAVAPQRAAFISAVAKRIGSPSALASAGVPELVGDPTSAVTVRRFLPGTPLPGRIDADTALALWRLFEATNDAIDRERTSVLLGSLPSFQERLAAAIAGADPSTARQIAVLLADSRVAEAVARRERIADLDMHRDNVLQLTGSRLTKIDFGALCSGSAQLPTACALVGTYVLYADEDATHDGAFWPGIPPAVHAELAKPEVATLVVLRLLLGQAYFEKARRRYTYPGIEEHLARYRRAIRTFEAVRSAGARHR